MWKLIRNACYMFGALVLLQSCVDSNEKLVDVTLFSKNNNIESTVKIENGTNGQKYIRISLTNSGNAIDKLDSIEVSLKSTLSTDKNVQLLYGGTCMGRTPIKQSTTSDSVSKSGTFLMIKNNEKSFTHIGILTWNTFLPYIQYTSKKGIVITAVGESKPIQPGETIKFEEIVITAGESWQDLMFGYGTEIGKVHEIKVKELLHFKGWSTWDYYGRVYDTKDVYKNIDMLKSEQVANIIQIDGGWWTARGDYLSVRKNLQGGMKAIANYAKSKGYKAGIHLDGFRGDKNSELYRNHPDWFLKDQDGEVICQEIDKGDAFMQYIYYDYSNPQVCDYMKNVFQIIKNDWGYSYFKIDFMRYGLLESILAEHGNNTNDIKKVTKISSFNENMTSVERTRAGLKAMREGMGDAYFLACSAIFGPTFGIVDGLRTGADICPTFDYYKRCTLGNAGNFYLNQTVVQNDADYLVVRNKDDEEPERAWGVNKFGGNTTFDEAKMWSDYIALYGGPKINSDNLLTLRPERKTLIDNAFAFKTANRFIPLDMWSHAKDSRDAFNVILAENEDGVYISLFNWDETDRNFDISGFSDSKVIDTSTKSNIKLKNSNLQITLKSHSSLILKVENSNFDVLRNKLQIL